MSDFKIDDPTQAQLIIGIAATVSNLHKQGAENSERQKWMELEETANSVHRLTTQLAECFRAAGSDPDGADESLYAHRAVQAVKDLRNDYDEVCKSEEALDAKVKALSPHGTCACSFDTPTDKCMHHSPQIMTLTAQLSETVTRVHTLEQRERLWEIEQETLTAQLEALKQRNAKLREACEAAYSKLTDIEGYGEDKDNPLPAMLRAAMEGK